ncbi:MAG: ECF transporter S component [Clostridiales bacterium]|nr:ECF transporter S component [Clostridiales bacterium]
MKTTTVKPTTVKPTTVKPTTVNRTGTRTMVCVGMLAAISTVLMLFEFPLPFIAPGFYELDFSEMPILIGAFAFGPMAGVMTELVKILLNLVVNGTDTAFVGEFANFVIGCSFLIPAALIYKKKKSRRSAVIGLAAGTVAMAAVGVIINAYVLLPAYSKAFGMPMEVFIEMGTAINPAINGVWAFVLLAVAPFNLIKGALVSVLTILLYKHISPILKGTR